MIRKFIVAGLVTVFASAAFAATPEGPAGGKKAKSGSTRPAKGKGKKQAASQPAIKGEEWKAKLAERQATLSDEQKAAIEKVKADVADLAANGAALEADLLALVQGEKKPTSESVAKLSTDLQKALTGKTLAEEQPMQLAQDLEILLNAASAEQPSVAAAQFDIRSILEKAEVAAEDLKAVGADLRAITMQLRGKGMRKGAASKPAAEADAEAGGAEAGE